MGFENFNEHSEGRVCSFRFDYEKKTSWFLKGKSIRVQGNDENRLYQPTFEYMQYLCGGNGIHVVRDTVYCTDVLGTANVSWILGQYYLQRPEGATRQQVSPLK